MMRLEERKGWIGLDNDYRRRRQSVRDKERFQKRRHEFTKRRHHDKVMEDMSIFMNKIKEKEKKRAENIREKI